MIPRYSRDKMQQIWEAENRYRIWFEIEAHACDAQAKLGLIPEQAATAIWQKGKFDVERINEIEAVTKHDVIAFLTNVAENVGEEARFIHLGLTSSDVLDTCFSVQLRDAADILIDDIKQLLEVIKRRAYETKDLAAIGRSHGIHAEPITFGLKFAYMYAEFERNLERVQQAKKEIMTCAISGAVGTFANINPFVQDYVAEKMGLVSETISTQVIPRDRHAAFFATLAVIAGSIERIATEIRHLQRTEVLEAEEYFSAGQKGSSAMPHKRNPILSENLCGLARMVRSYALPALENVALWHERDISHSSVERYIGPDATVTLDFALVRLCNMLDKLAIHPSNIERNLNLMNGLIFSQRVMLALTEKKMSREDAYQAVQRNAMRVWEEGLDFKKLIDADPQINNYLTTREIEELFDLNYHTKHIDSIFKNVFGE
jgi:adenylosuccinate lyase